MTPTEAARIVDRAIAMHLQDYFGCGRNRRNEINRGSE
jgi:hypothetical protein